MKILHIIVGLEKAGAEQVLFDVLKEISKKSLPSKHFVVSMTTKGYFGEHLESLSIPVYTLGMRRGLPSFRALLRFIRFIKEASPDAVQGWMYHGNLLASFAKLVNRNIKIFWAVHHSLSDLKTERPLTRLLVRLGSVLSAYTDKIIYVSTKSAEQHEKIGYKSNKTVVIPNGIDLSRFRLLNGEVLREELNIASELPVVTLIARDHPVKDHELFFKAIEQIMQYRKAVHFVLAGANVSNKNLRFVKLRGSTLYPDHIHLLGERGDIEKILSASTISVNCSKSEAFPVSVAEAMACRVPCVVTDVGDSAYLLGKNGKVVPPSDSKALAEAILSLLSLSNDERYLIGKAARIRVQTFFSIQSIVSLYDDLYQERDS